MLATLAHPTSDSTNISRNSIGVILGLSVLPHTQQDRHIYKQRKASNTHTRRIIIIKIYFSLK